MRMPRHWAVYLTLALGAAALLLVVYAAVAQAPPAAPAAPAERPAAEAPAVPPMPGDRRAELQERMDQMQRMWAMMRGPGGNSQPIMQIVGDHVYLLYGPYLCQFSVNGLQLEGKVDLREALGLDERMRDLNRERARRQPAAPEPRPAEPAAPAAPGAPGAPAAPAP
jgi:hypothetical protein